jgi:hypothetical protein
MYVMKEFIEEIYIKWKYIVYLNIFLIYIFLYYIKKVFYIIMSEFYEEEITV